MAEPKNPLERLETASRSSAEKARATDARLTISDYQEGVKRVFDFYQGDDELALKLSVAVSRGDAQQATQFIARGADVNLQQQADRLPLIHDAVSLGHTAIVDAMLASGRCDLTVRDSMGRLASDIASLAGDGDLAERLAEQQAKQFHARKMDPRRPDHPDYGNWKWDT